MICKKCNKIFEKDGKFDTLCKHCRYIQRRIGRRKNSIAKVKRKVFAYIRVSEWIHPKVRGEVIREIKWALKKKQEYSELNKTPKNFNKEKVN
jgi:hypothetical protein